MHGEAVCDIPCPGDSGEMCGGYLAMSVYVNDGNIDPVDPPAEEPVDPVDPTEYGYMGCFADMPGTDRYGVALCARFYTPDFVLLRVV